MAKNLTTGLQRGLRQSIAGGLGTGDLFSTASLDLQFARHKSLDSRVTHTRQSSATYVDGDRVIRTAVTNLLLRSEELDQSPWVPLGTGAGVTANLIESPTGFVTADKVEKGAATFAGVYYSTTLPGIAGATYTASVYAKAGTLNEVRLILRESGSSDTIAFHTVDLSNGSTIDSRGSVTAVDVGNGWWRIGASAAAPSATNLRVYLLVGDGSESTAGDAYLWGAQLEQSSTVGQYVKTTTAINSAPRFDHDPETGESLGLLVEESRTNLLSYSEEFDQSGWTANDFAITVSSNQALAPNSTNTADSLVPDSGVTLSPGGITSYIRQDISKGAAATTYTLSVYAKSFGLDAFRLYVRDSASSSNGAFATYSLSAASFILAADAIGTFSGASGTIANAGNGWYKCTLTYTTSTETGNRIIVSPSSSTTITADGTSGIYLWGAQLEAGSFPTSYIPTEGSTVTRAADVTSITGTNFSSWYSQSEGTIFANAICPKTPFVIPHIFCATDGTTSNRTRLFVYAALSDKGYYQVGTAGGGQCDLLSSSGYTEGQDVIAACVYKANDFAASYNGGSVVTDNTGTVPSLSDFLIGTENNATNHLNGTIRRLTYWPTRLSNDTLQTITR